MHVFYLTDDWKALNYILEFRNCNHKVKYLKIKIRFRKTSYIKLINWVIGFKKDQLRKVMYSYAIKVPVADRNFFCSILFESWVEFSITT